MVSVPDWLLLTAQWVHLMGAVTWVGGSIFFKFVLQPAFRGVDNAPGSMRAVGHEFGNVVRIAIVILVVTGAFMAVVHLTAGGNSRVYIGILALKIALAFYMFLVVWLRRRSAPAASSSGSGNLWPGLRRAATSTTALLILGIVIIGLADVLSAVGGHNNGGHGHGGQAEEVEESGHIETADVSDDHHKPEVVVEEATEAAATPEPTQEAKGGEADGHEDDEEQGEGDEEEDGDEEREEQDHEDEEDDEEEDDHGDGHSH